MTAARQPGPTFATYLDRHDRNQLDARVATAEQERDDALDDLQDSRRQIAELTAKLEDRRIRLRDADNDLLNVRGILSPNGYPQRVPVDLVPTVAPAVQWLADRVDTLTTERDEALDALDVLRQQLDQQSAILASKRNTITALAAELGAAQELIATVRDAAERIDRAIAHYETQQQEQALKHVSVVGNCIACGSRCPNGRCPNDAPPPGLGSPADRAQDEPEREEVRWAYRWIGRDGQVYDEMDASDNAIETAEQRAHRIAAKRLTGTVRGEVLRYRVLTMPAEVVATYPFEAPA